MCKCPRPIFPIVFPVPCPILIVKISIFSVSAANNMQYGQNISIPYSQPQGDLNFLNAAAAADHKGKIHPKIERDREEGESSASRQSGIEWGRVLRGWVAPAPALALALAPGLGLVLALVMGSGGG